MIATQASITKTQSLELIVKRLLGAQKKKLICQCYINEANVQVVLVHLKNKSQS